MTIENGFAGKGGVVDILKLVALFTVWFLATIAVLCVMEVGGLAARA